MSAARKNKKTRTGTPVENALDVMGAMAKKTRVGGVGFTTAAQSAADWRWIDFIDPKTGLPALLLEYLWGCRGMLAGRLLKIEAEEGVGKSSYCALQYAMAMATADAWCMHLEGEGATAPPDFIASFGCDPTRVMTPQFDVRAIDVCFNTLDLMAYYIRRAPKNAEDKDIIDPDMKNPIVAGVDSISSFGTAANMDDEGASLDTGQGGLGLHSRFLSQWFRDKWTIQTRRDMLLMAVTQLREKINTAPSFPGAPRKAQGEKTTLAARPLNYHASYRLEMRGKPLRQQLGEGRVGPEIGEVVTLITTKNKLSPKGKRINVPLIWDHGFQLTVPTIEQLMSLSPLELHDGSKFELSKAGMYLKCPMLWEGTMACKNEDIPQVYLDVLQRLCANTDLLMCIREALRIRGFGFRFEQNYIPSPVELEDLTQSEDEAAKKLTEEA